MGGLPFVSGCFYCLPFVSDALRLQDLISRSICLHFKSSWIDTSESVDSSLLSVWKISLLFPLKKFPFLLCVFLPSGILISCDLELVIVAFMNLNLSFTFLVSLPLAVWVHDFFQFCLPVHWFVFVVSLLLFSPPTVSLVSAIISFLGFYWVISQIYLVILMVFCYSFILVNLISCFS